MAAIFRKKLMKDIRPEKPTDKIEISTKEARGGRLGRPVLYVLIGSTAGAIIASLVFYLLIAP